MSEVLNFRDRRVVRSYMRPGLIVCLIIITLFIIVSYFIAKSNPEMEEFANRFMMLGIIIALVVAWIMNRKYIKDLSVGIKIIENGNLTSKYKSGDKLLFSINAKEYEVESDIWEAATEGDKLEIHFSGKSKILLEMRLIEKGICNYY